MASTSTAHWTTAIAERWDREAAALEREAQAESSTLAERRLKNMHARAKRGCAQELRIESMRIVNRGR